MGGTEMGTIVKYAVTAAVSLLIGLLLAMLLGRCSGQEEVEVRRETIYDTIPYYKPVPVDSCVTRYEVVKLPAVRDTLRTSVVFVDTVQYDSVNVVVPITQKKYSDSTYTAWVSGFRPNLDSIKIYRKTVYQTTTKYNKRRFGIGLMGGYGYGINGFTPFVGVGIYYNIFNL